MQIAGPMRGAGKARPGVTISSEGCCCATAHAAARALRTERLGVGRGGVSFGGRQALWGGCSAARGGREAVACASNGDAPTVDLGPGGLQSRWADVPRVSYQGVPGAFSALAAADTIPGCEPVSCESVSTVLSSVTHWTSDLAIVPVHNTLEGNLHENQDQLLNCGLHIVREVTVPVAHNLAALPGVKREDVSRVLSHPQDLAQCASFLGRLDEERAAAGAAAVVREAVHDAAFAAKAIRDGELKSTACLASASAAAIYGLEILSEGVDDADRASLVRGPIANASLGANATQYILLGREPADFDPQQQFKVRVCVRACERASEHAFASIERGRCALSRKKI